MTTKRTRFEPKIVRRVKRWETYVSAVRGKLFSSARPGRHLGKNAKVPDSIVCDWITSLPLARKTFIVSLLGLRKDGRSEFRYYNFCGRNDKARRPKDPTFQEWLDKNFPGGRYQVMEHPTQDYKNIPPENLRATVLEVKKLLDQGETVVLMDSGGDTRVGKVAGKLGFHPG